MAVIIALAPGGTVPRVARTCYIDLAIGDAMSTTTIRLPELLKSRIDKLAAAAGKSSHAFMVDALAQTAESMEREQAFEAEVNRRWTRFQRTREYISLEDMRDYAKALADGKRPPRSKVQVLEAELRMPKTAKTAKTAKSA